MARRPAEQPGPVAQAVLSLDLWLVSWGFAPPPAFVLAEVLGCSDAAVRQARGRWWPWAEGEVPQIWVVRREGALIYAGAMEGNDMAEYHAARALATE